MNPSVRNPATRTASEALERLLASETWAGIYDKHRHNPDQLAARAGRFRAALVGLGDSYSEEEVRAALLERAGSGPSTPAVPEPPAPAPTPDPPPEPEPGLNQRQRDIEQALDSMTGPAASADPPPESAPAPATDPGDREASKVLYRLYDHGVCLALREGQLHAGRTGGLTPLQRELIQEHGAGLKRLLSPEAMSEVWAPAPRYVSEALRERGCAPDGAEARRAAALLNEAQEAYERHEDGLARYRLRRAALVSAGRE